MFISILNSADKSIAFYEGVSPSDVKALVEMTAIYPTWVDGKKYCLDKSFIVHGPKGITAFVKLKGES